MTPVTRVLPFSSAQSFGRPSTVDLRDTAQCLLGPSAAMARLWSQIRVLAPHFRMALLCGESGSGAMAVAQALHDLSSFADTPLLKLHGSEADRQLRNPAALLAGGVRGAIFLADVDRLSAHGQQSLLRILRLRRHRRIAVVASTTRDLRSLIGTGSFSAELAAQLGSLCLLLPSLRERAADIPLLASHLLLSEAARLALPAPELDASFLAHAAESAWPGNLDQLRGAVTWLLKNRQQHTLAASDLDAALAQVQCEPVPAEAPVRMVPLDHVVQEHVRAVLIGCNGNKLRAAEILGISRSTLYRMLDAASVTDSHNSLALAG
jgi:DNA-binding NtrC family response regulator